MRMVLLAGFAGALLSADPALAQPAGRADDFTRGYAMDNDSWDDPVRNGSEDADQHAVIDGRVVMLGGTTLSGGLTDMGLSAVAPTRNGVKSQGNTLVINSNQFANAQDANAVGARQ